MAEESPFIEGEQTKPAETEVEKIDVDALLGQLEKFGVTDAKKLEGKLRNATDYSKVQSERDQLANELANIRAEIASFKQSPKRQRDDSFESMVDSGQPIDVETLAANAARRALREELKEQQQATMRHQEWMNKTWKKISGHNKYHLVKEDFENALRDPGTVMEIQTGQRDPIEMYYDLLVGKYEGITKQTVQAFKQLRGSSSVEAPHVESNARAPQMTKQQLTDKQKKIQELTKAAHRPGGLHSDEEDLLLDAALGDLLK